MKLESIYLSLISKDLLIFSVICFGLSNANWLYLGMISSLAMVHREDTNCAGIKGLVYKQLEICRNNPNTILCVGEGVRRGIYECRAQFQFERWNCSTASDVLSMAKVGKPKHFYKPYEDDRPRKEKKKKNLPQLRSLETYDRMMAEEQVYSKREMLTSKVIKEKNHDKEKQKSRLSLAQMSVLNATKEKAFINAITSSGVVYSVTKACSLGNLTDCSCDLSMEGKKHKDGWKWGGCSDDVNYGIWFARSFVDAPNLDRRNKNDVRALVNLHNNDVGRQSVAHKLMVKCRCHGVSGSCAVKSCWKELPAFKIVGDYLKTLYDKTVQVAPRLKKSRLRRKEPTYRKVPVTDQDLVYLDKSPNYCKKDPLTGMPGTRGRICKKNSKGPESCELLCCGRGYTTKIEKIVERCYCKFIWCCQVKCKLCETIHELHTCN